MPSSGGAGGGTAGYPYATGETVSAARFTAVDPDFVIAVLDTGVTVDGLSKKPHPFIAGNLMAGWEQYPDPLEDYHPESAGYGGGWSTTAGPQDGHGTFVAGRILREAPFATLAMRNPLDGPTPPPVLDNEHRIAAAIRGLTEVANLRLVNLGSYNVLPEPKPPLQIKEALNELFGKHPHVVVVTSLANNWRDEVVWPAGFNTAEHFGDGIIAVGAVDETPTPYVGQWRPPPKASFASWGGVDVWASGVSVLGPHLQPGAKLVGGEATSGWVRWSGSPFATAAVTGMIARRMKQSQIEEVPLTARQAFAALVKDRPRVEVPGVPASHWKPWLRELGSRWREFPGAFTDG